jgi:hypothetical protein
VKAENMVPLVVLGAIAVALAQCVPTGGSGGSGGASYSATANSSPSKNYIKYRVSGDTTEAALTYTNAQGGTQQEKVSLPWERDEVFPNGQSVYISAQNQKDWGAIKVEILLNSIVVKSSTSSGAYVIARASGKCC